MLAAHLAAGASLRDAYAGAGYDGNPDHGQCADLAKLPEVAARIGELAAARSAALVARAPAPVGLPSVDTWLAEFAALAREAQAAGAYSAAATAYDKVLRHMGVSSQGVDIDTLTAEQQANLTVKALVELPDYPRALARALAGASAVWQQLQVSVQGYRQGA